MPKNSREALIARIAREFSSEKGRWQARHSYAALAERLGVGKETVRMRLRRAFEEKLLTGWELVINPQLIGRSSAVLVLEFEDSKRKPSIISQLQLLEGVVHIIDYLDGGLRLLLYYETEEELARKTKLITAICNCRNPLSWRPPSPPCDMRPKRTDWEIIRELRKNPRRSLSEVAKDLRVSTRTVKRRISSMNERNAFFVRPKPNLRQSKSTAYIYLVRFSNEKKKVAADQTLGSTLRGVVFTDTLAKGYSTFAVVMQNRSQAEELTKRINELDGVDSVDRNIIKDIISVHPWLDEEIDKRMVQIETHS